MCWSFDNIQAFIFLCLLEKNFVVVKNLYRLKEFFKSVTLTFLGNVNTMPIEHAHHQGTFFDETTHWRASSHLGLGWVGDILTVTLITGLDLRIGLPFLFHYIIHVVPPEGSHQRSSQILESRVLIKVIRLSGI